MVGPSNYPRGATISVPNYTTRDIPREYTRGGPICFSSKAPDKIPRIVPVDASYTGGFTIDVPTSDK